MRLKQGRQESGALVQSSALCSGRTERGWSLLIALGGIATLLAQEPLVDVPYLFPVRPGTPEWAALRTGSEMYRATDIPEHQVRLMTTRALVASCLDYPLKANVFASSSAAPFAPYRFLAAGFAGLRELPQRTDAGAHLLAAYRSLSAEARSSGVPIPLIDHVYIQVLLSGPGIVSNLSDAHVMEWARLSAQNAAVQRAYHGLGASEGDYAEAVRYAVFTRKLAVTLGGTRVDIAAFQRLADATEPRDAALAEGRGRRAIDFIVGLALLDLGRGR